MDDKKLKKLLKGMDEDVKVPKNLAAKISRSVGRHAKVLERRMAIWSGVKVAVALLLGIYALTGIVVNLMNAHIWEYLSTVFEAPSVFFSSEGLIGLYERLPLLSGLLLLVAGVYVIRHLAIKGIRKSPYVFATVMSSFAVVLVTGAFVAGMAISVNSGEDMQELAGEGLFDPVINTVGQHEYSNFGTVMSITVAEGATAGMRELTLELENGETRIARMHKNVIGANEVKIGDQIMVVGKPMQNQAPSATYGAQEDTRLVEGFAEDDPAHIEVQYVKILTN